MPHGNRSSSSYFPGREPLFLTLSSGAEVDGKKGKNKKKRGGWRGGKIFQFMQLEHTPLDHERPILVPLCLVLRSPFRTWAGFTEVRNLNVYFRKLGWRFFRLCPLWVAQLFGTSVTRGRSSRCLAWLVKRFPQIGFTAKWEGVVLFLWLNLTNPAVFCLLIIFCRIKLGFPDPKTCHWTLKWDAPQVSLAGR